MGKKYKFIQKLNERQVHVFCDGNHFVASLALTKFSPKEILVFPATSNGEITEYREEDSCFKYDKIDEWVKAFCSV